MQLQLKELDIPKTDQQILDEIHKKILFNIEQLKKAQKELRKEMKI